MLSRFGVRVSPKLLLWAAIAGAALSACNSTPAPQETQSCVPGHSVPCTGVGGCSGGQVCDSNGMGFGPCRCGGSKSSAIGPAGGTVEMGGASITVPPAALPTRTNITITVRTDMPPSAYQACSAFYEFDPPGLVFAKPASVVLPDHGCSPTAAIYWSKVGGVGFDRLATTLATDSASAYVTHFSSGFVGGPAPIGPTPDGGVDSTLSDAGGDVDATLVDSSKGPDSSSTDSASGPDSVTDSPVDTAPPPCTGPAGCPLGQACNSGTCWTFCSASTPCNGGCCDGVMCQPGTTAVACGTTGGACVVCSGSTPSCGITGTCVVCASESDCPVGQACNGGLCSATCSTSSPCHGGCCDGSMCQPGTATGLCGSGGGACASCSGSTPFCGASGACVQCMTESDCTSGEACKAGSCTSDCSGGLACNGTCCWGGLCCLRLGSSTCGPITGSVCNPYGSGEACNYCTPAYACTASGTCGCEVTASNNCPAGQACDSTTGLCGTSCTTGYPLCNGTCCDGTTGMCAPSPEPATACGRGATLSCIDCTTTSCTSNGVLGRPGGRGCPLAAGLCGCNSDADCSSCDGSLTVCNTTTHVCSLPDAGTPPG